MSRERFNCQQTHLKFNTTYRSRSGFLIDYLPRTFLPASPRPPLPHPRYKIRGKERRPRQTWHRPARAKGRRRDPRREGAGRDGSDPRRCAAAGGARRRPGRPSPALPQPRPGTARDWLPRPAAPRCPAAPPGGASAPAQREAAQAAPSGRAAGAGPFPPPARAPG